MRALFLSDLHLTDNPADEYRWEVFEQAGALAREHALSELFVLGDLCEFKDYHSSRLVNRVVNAFYRLRKACPLNEVHFLKGNHDGLDPALPYFLFLNRLPWAHFYVEPTRVDRGKEVLLFLPHTRRPDTDWAEVEMGEATHIFLHGTVNGAQSETGHKMDGISLDWFKGLRCTILAGDVHVPQDIGPVTYVGAPYHIRFGDEFEGRALAIKDKEHLTFPLSNIRKLTLRLEGPVARAERTLAKELRRGDHVRFIIALAASELGEWQERKQWCADLCFEHGAHLMKVQLERKDSTADKKAKAPRIKARTPEESLTAYCRDNAVEEPIAEVGHQLLMGEESSSETK